jgi:hypothetical protein
MKFFRHLVLPILASGLIMLTFSACDSGTSLDNTVEVKNVKNYDSKVIQEWQDLFLQVERYAEVYRPCPAARMAGYVGLAVYEANVAGMPEYKSLASRYSGLNIPTAETGKEYHWPTVTNAVYATLYKKFFANVRSSDIFKIAALESTINIGFANSISAETIRRSKDFGTQVANAVWDYSATNTLKLDQQAMYHQQVWVNGSQMPLVLVKRCSHIGVKCVLSLSKKKINYAAHLCHIRKIKILPIMLKA